jgi:hypothetical protein
MGARHNQLAFEAICAFGLNIEASCGNGIKTITHLRLGDVGEAMR